MGVGEALDALGAGERPASFEQFSAALDTQWIVDALAAADIASVRRRKLPAEHVVWLVIGMGLLRERSIAQVVEHLDLVMPTTNGTRHHITNAAIVQARDQLGVAPLATLFTQTATTWAHPLRRTSAGAGWRSTAWMAPPCASPTRSRMSPTSSGRRAVTARARGIRKSAWSRSSRCALGSSPPRPSARNAPVKSPWRGRSGPRYPTRGRHPGPRLLQLRPLPCARDVGPRPALDRARPQRADALTQAVIVRFSAGDALVELRPSRATRAQHPDLPPTLRVRAVRVHRRGCRPYWVFTSLLNPATHPAAEISALYHERWELELAFDELKTHTCERVEALRSKAPYRVEQEVWGLLLGYNLVRLVIGRAAPRAGVPPGA